MSILTGFKKVKNYILTSSGYQLLSRWTSSQTVEFDDGKTAQEKLGEINGIAKTYVDMKKVTDNSMAASAKAVMEGLENSSALISMTQAEYDALSDEEKTDNNMRAIIDANPDVVDAKNVNFDNTDTNLAATNTQSAITELNGKLNRFGNLNVKSTNDGTLPNIIQKNGFYLIVAKRWTVADAGIVCLCDWVDGSEPYIYIVQKSDTFMIATNSDGTITAMFNGYTSGVYLTVMRLY